MASCAFARYHDADEGCEYSETPMISSRARGLYHAHAIALCVSLSLSFWLYFWLLSTAYYGESDLLPGRYIAYWLIAITGLLYEIIIGDEQQLSLFTRDTFQDIRKAGRQTLYVAGALMLTLLLTKDRTISRFFLFTYLPILWVALCFLNMLLPRVLSRFLFEGRYATSAMLVGPVARVPKLHRWIRYMESFGVKVVGLVSDDPPADATENIPIIGKLDDLPAILSAVTVQTVILLEVPEEGESLNRITAQTERAGVRLVTVNSLSERYRHALQYFNQFGVDFITIREEPLENPVSRLTKRTIDIAFALPVVILILPFLALIVLIIQRIQSPGPLLYRQRRAGIQNRPFEILKFRTMHVTNADASRQATSDDERIYPLGRLLRRMSLDEFPQFLNVLRDDMSVVGPRPHMTEHNRGFAEVMSSYQVRSYIKPGVTGLAQVRGFRGEARTDEDIQHRVECDIEYIERWSVLLDLLIILRTAHQLFFPPKSAY